MGSRAHEGPGQASQRAPEAYMGFVTGSIKAWEKEEHNSEHGSDPSIIPPGSYQEKESSSDDGWPAPLHSDH